MRVHDCNWKMLEEYLGDDDRIVLPIGSTEQHGYLSVGTDERGGLPALAFGFLLDEGAVPGLALSRRRRTCGSSPTGYNGRSSTSSKSQATLPPRSSWRSRKPR